MIVKVAIIVLPGCIPTSVTLPLDILTTANCIQDARSTAGSDRRFDITLVGERAGPVATVNRLQFQVDRGFGAKARYDLVIVPAFGGDMRDVLQANAEALRFLKRQKKAGALLASSCTGSFLLAAAGVLDGRRATTHWRYFEQFRTLFPKIALDTEHMVVAQKGVYSAAGSTAAGDLALTIARKFMGVDTARRAARMLLLDLNRPREAYVEFQTAINHADDSIREAQHYMQKQIRSQINVADAADHVGLSRRHFTRRFLRATGHHPLRYIQKLKIEHARDRLERSAATVDAIAYEIGYENLASFRKVFKGLLGLSPSEYRRRFQR